jgi:hypothetical protein
MRIAISLSMRRLLTGSTTTLRENTGLSSLRTHKWRCHAGVRSTAVRQRMSPIHCKQITGYCCCRCVDCTSANARIKACWQAGGGTRKHTMDGNQDDAQQAANTPEWPFLSAAGWECNGKYPASGRRRAHQRPHHVELPRAQQFAVGCLAGGAFITRRATQWYCEQTRGRLVCMRHPSQHSFVSHTTG